ncbi:hypothetical protein [Haemophilus influenzae]|uniref:hypothetical protein n=1 Tax=Haemophilus influenzae TaxID=727 RepID=UPI0018640044|nr:hypothetical protein [Haemophilus influenzae]
MLSQIRPHLQQGKSIQVDIIGTSIHFADGTQIGLVSKKNNPIKNACVKQAFFYPHF